MQTKLSLPVSKLNIKPKFKTIKQYLFSNHQAKYLKKTFFFYLTVFFYL